MGDQYDVCVIGGGLFGSACAKYASEDVSTILIGPSEESRNKIHRFGAWHDEGRITTPWFKTVGWRDVTQKSIARYRQIEEQSSLPFYTEVGFLKVLLENESSKEELESVQALADAVTSLGFSHQKIDDSNVKELFPYLCFPEGVFGFFQLESSGYISPRQLVRAQLTIAKENGCVTLDGQVTNVTKSGDSSFTVTYSTPDSSEVKSIRAKQLILAPGAYTNLNSWIKDLIPEEMKGLEPDLTLQTQTVAYLELDPSEAERLKKMPTMCTNYSSGKLDGTYILPPILYPDGKYYLKLGHGDIFEKTLKTHKEVTEWYKSEEGCSEAVQALADFIQRSLVPDIKVESVHGGCCVTSVTPGKIGPYIDHLADGVTLVAGGNGYGAKCSDEIGRLGAKLTTKNIWDSIIPHEDCKIMWRSQNEN